MVDLSNNNNVQGISGTKLDTGLGYWKKGGTQVDADNNVYDIW